MWSCNSLTQTLNLYIYVYKMYVLHIKYNAYYIQIYIFYTSYCFLQLPWIKSKFLIILLMAFLTLISDNFPHIISFNPLDTGFAYNTQVVCNSLNTLIDFKPSHFCLRNSIFLEWPLHFCGHLWYPSNARSIVASFLNFCLSSNLSDISLLWNLKPLSTSEST